MPFLYIGAVSKSFLNGFHNVVAKSFFNALTSDKSEILHP